MFTATMALSKLSNVEASKKEELLAPDFSTTALPGSEEKAMVFADRGELGRQLWHSLDRTWCTISVGSGAYKR